MVNNTPTLDMSGISSTAPPVSAGKPLDIPLVDIEEDPNQVRTEFDDEGLQELADDIAKRDVKTPVSVRKNPTRRTPWMLNYGARRYRASKLANKPTIPGFPDEQFDSYDQVAENEKRRDLSIIELALFIKKRKDQGDSNRLIAKRLGKHEAAMTQYLALVDAPACVEKAIRTNQVTAARAGYELRKLHSKHPEQVDSWCKAQEVITVKSIKVLADSLKPKPDELEEQGNNRPIPLNADKPDTLTPETPPTVQDEPKPSSKKTKPTPIAKPVLVVSYQGREAIVLLDQRPAVEGRVFIRFDDDRTIKEVTGKSCEITMLIDESLFNPA